ncbi:MAG TPA: DUF4286 family protein [Gammaproteobacteria bacterium]|nr:DUF4286 family protein [Gammaproteobacteria bacterium]
MNISTPLSNSVVVYEVNLTISTTIFEEHQGWLIDHFHSMVTENNFIKLNLFFVENMDPTNDEHLRNKKIVVQYYVSDFETLQKYFEKQAKQMRNQVVSRLGQHYSVSRRVFKLIETFHNEDNQLC